MNAEIFTTTSLYSLGAVVVLLGLSSLSAGIALPNHAGKRDSFVFTWLAFDALIHFFLEGSFLYLSLFGRTVQTSEGFRASMWKEYALADYRWGNADPTVVSIELLTVLGAGPMCCYILYLLSKNDLSQHYWIIILSTAEIYGGCMTFFPEWLTGSTNLNTSNFLYTWVYLALMNLIWVFIPLWLLVDSYSVVAQALRCRTTARLNKAL